MRSQNCFATDERSPPAGPKANTSKSIALCNLAVEQERFRIRPSAAYFERAEIFVSISFGHFRLRGNPKKKLVEVRDGDSPITHAINEMLAVVRG